MGGGMGRGLGVWGGAPQGVGLLRRMVRDGEWGELRGRKGCDVAETTSTTIWGSGR